MAGGKVSIGGVEFRLPGWSVACLAGLVVLGAFAWIWTGHLLPAYEQTKTSAFEGTQFDEAMKHAGEAPDVTVLDLPGLTVSFFASDGCLVVNRRGVGVETHLFVVDPGTFRAMAASSPGADGFLATPAGAQGRCYDSHPGEFRWWWGSQLDSCWREIWREWPDGCRHVQPYNTCNGYWGDVRWIRCVH